MGWYLGVEFLWGRKIDRAGKLTISCPTNTVINSVSTMGWYLGVEFLWGRKIDHFLPHKNCHASTHPQPLHIPFPCPYLVPGSIAGFAKPNNKHVTCSYNNTAEDTIIAQVSRVFLVRGLYTGMEATRKAPQGYRLWKRRLRAPTSTRDTFAYAKRLREESRKDLFHLSTEQTPFMANSRKAKKT